MRKPTALQRLRELFGKHLGLFGEILSAGPVVFSCRSLGFIEERIYFRSQVGLGGVQVMSLRSCQVARRLRFRPFVVGLLLSRSERVAARAAVLPVWLQRWTRAESVQRPVASAAILGP